MRKSLLILILLIAVEVSNAEGVSVSYQVSPQILLPGDYADVTLILKNPSTSDVKVNSIVVSGARAEPSAIYSVGTIPAGGSYTMTFSVKGEEIGRKNVQVEISTENETVTQNIMIVVDDSFPSLTITSTLHGGC